MTVPGSLQGFGQSIVATTASCVRTTNLPQHAVRSFMVPFASPQTVAMVQGCRLIARTLKKLRAGDPVEHCYGPQQGEMVTAERRRLLQAQYHFYCK